VHAPERIANLSAFAFGEAAHHEQPAGCDELCDPRRRLHQHPAREVPEHDVVSLHHCDRAKVGDSEFDRKGQRVQRRAFTCRLDSVGIDINRAHFTCAFEGSRHRKHAGPRAEVEHALPAHVDRGQCAQAQARRRVMASAKPARGLNDNRHDARLGRRRHIPWRRDDEISGADGDKGALRSGGPILVCDVDALERHLRYLFLERGCRRVARLRGVEEHAPVNGRRWRVRWRRECRIP
jgi:hypothetical protein